MPFIARVTVVLSLILALASRQAILEAQESLTIGWAELDTAGLDAEMSRLGILLPKALMKATSFIEERYMPQREALVHALKTTNLDLEKAKDAVAASQRRRDLVSISTRDPAKRATELRSAQAALDKNLMVLNALLIKQTGIPDTAASLVSTLKIWKGHEEGTLVPPVGVAALVCAENKLDILVYGKIEALGPFLTVDLVLYSAATDEEVWRAAEYAAFDDLDGLVESLERPLATALAGRPFGRAIFDISPENAEILVDGRSYPTNNPLFYSQGSYLATISAAGYRTLSSRFAIIPGNDTFVGLKLEPLKTVPVFVESMPSGASLFLDGAPVGATPLELAGAAYPRVLTARMEGFDDLKMVVRPGINTGRLVLDLQASDGLEYADRFELAKGAFYQSLGWFILSLPVTVLSYGTFNSYLRLAPLPFSVSEKTANTLTLYYYGSQTVFWISAAVSASLATNTIVRLVRYIKAAH
jgi:hypothetical protein